MISKDMKRKYKKGRVSNRHRYKYLENPDICRFCKRKNVELHISSTNKQGTIYFECKQCCNKRMKKYYKTKNKCKRCITGNLGRCIICGKN